jgi:hypothetical protein
MANEFVVRNGLVVISGEISGTLAANIVFSNNIASGQVVKALTQGSNVTISVDANDNYTINASISGGVAISPVIVSSGLVLSSGSFFDGMQSGVIIGIQSGGITSELIADNAITSGKYASGSIGQFAIASGVITANHIASGAIIAADIADNAVTSGKIASGTIGSLHVSSGGITNVNLGDASVNTRVLASGSVDNTKLSSGAVVSGQIGNNAVVSGSIASGSIGQFALSSGAVNSGQVGNNAVVSGSIASGSIGQFHHASGSVTSGHIGNAAVVSGSIASGNITTFHINAGGLLSGAIGSGQIGSSHIASGTLFSVTNAVDNRVLTSLASGSNSANAEANFTFDGNALNVGLISGLSTFTVTSGGYVKIQSSLMSGKSATFDANVIPQADGVAAFYDYYVYNSDNAAYRAGNIVTAWNTLSGIIVFSETGTDDLGGSTIDLSWSTVLQSGNVVLRSTLTAGTWNVKVGARVL